MEMPDDLKLLVVEMFNSYMLYGEYGRAIHPFERLRRDKLAQKAEQRAEIARLADRPREWQKNWSCVCIK